MIAHRTCPLCEATCGLAIEVADGRVERIRGDAGDVFSHGFLCPKGVSLKPLHEDPDRLRVPLVDGDEATWGEAFAVIDERLGAVRLIQAEAEARSNELIAASLENNPELLQYQYILKLSPGVQTIFIPSGNQFILPLIGTPGLNYQLQTSTNLINWNVLTNVLLTNSTASFIDSDILNYPRRFYRLLGP